MCIRECASESKRERGGEWGENTAGKTRRNNARGLLSNLTAQTSPPADCFDSRGVLHSESGEPVAVKELCTEGELMRKSNPGLEKQSGSCGRWLHVLSRVCTKRPFFPAFSSWHRRSARESYVRFCQNNSRPKFVSENERPFPRRRTR